MIIAERTRQQLDPAATFGAYRSTVVLAAWAVIWAFGSAIVNFDSETRVGLTFASLTVLTVAALWMLKAAHPLRAPFRRHSMVTVYALALIAIVISGQSHAGSDFFFADDWATLVIAILTIGMTPYRPAAEMFVALGIVSAFIALLTLINVLSMTGRVGPAMAYVVITLSTMIAVSIAAIQYSKYLVEGLQSWHRRADVGAASLASDMVGGVATSVERDRISILSRDVSPFFTELLARGEVGESDRERARSIAESMRAVLVEDANKTWLTFAFGQTERGPDFIEVDDPHYLAGDMVARQRTAVRAILVAAIDDERMKRVRMSIRREGDTVKAALDLEAASNAPVTLAADYDTYFSVLRVVFSACHVEADEGNVNVRFDYDRA